MTELEWVTGARAYADRSATLMHGDPVPILVPEGEPRRRRWRDVLAWYAAGRGTPAPGDPDDVVVALDPDSVAAAHVLGAATCRPVRTAFGDDIGALDRDPSRSMVLVGMPASLSVRRVHRLAATLDRPWGVVTAVDPAGLSFAVAKQLLARRRPDPAALVDMRLSRMRCTDDNGRWPEFQPLADDRVLRWLCERDWDVLCLDAHGEGAHVNLGTVVLCGVVDGAERRLDGTPIVGCTEDPPSCKRATAPGQRVLPVRDLRARELFLASCNGFAVAGDMYPSDLSCVLSAADGYPARVLTTDRLTVVDHWLPPALLELRSVASPGRVRELANDIGLRLTGVRPWILFGDPCGTDEPLPALGQDGSLPATPSARSIVPFRHDGPADRVLDAAGGRLALGVRHGLLVPERPESGPWEVSDRTADWTRLSTRMAELGRRVRWSAGLEHAARRLLAARHIVDADEALRAVRAARLRLEYVARTGLRECEDVRRRGVWNPVLTRQADVVSLCVAAWDEAAATLLADHLFEGVEQVLADGWPARGGGAGEPCARCGTPLLAATLRDPLDDEPDRCVSTCPVCGPSASHRVNGPQVSVELPDRLVAGQPARILVTTVDTRREPLVDHGLLRCDVVDKGWGTAFCRLSTTLGATTHELVIDVPANLRPDLHTVRVLWARGLDVASCRARVPGLTR